jgi:hypothetical protein
MAPSASISVPSRGPQRLELVELLVLVLDLARRLSPG